MQKNGGIKNKWEKVRSKWVNIYNRKTDLTLKNNNNGKPLFMFLFDEKVNNEKEINSTIESFIVY